MLYSFKNLSLIIVAITLYRLYFIWHGGYDLYADESYYWGWAQSFEFGYYSKPPMVAWIIMLGQSLCGEEVFCIKFLSPLIHFFTASFIYFIALELTDKRSAFYAALIYATLPAVWLSSVIISTDVPFLFCWSGALYFFIKAERENRVSYWALAGIFAGFGLLSKYTMIMFLVSVFAYIFASKKTFLLKERGLYLASVIAAIVFLPNLLWNASNRFSSFLHTKDNAHLEGSLFHIDKLFEFLGSQFGVFGPIFFALLLYRLFLYKKLSENEKRLFWFIVPFFVLILTVAFLSRAHANWSAPMYIASSVLIGIYLAANNKKRLLALGLGINIFAGIFFYNLEPITDMLHIELKQKQDPFKSVKGWEKVGMDISEVLREHSGAKLLCDDRKIMAQLIYYVKPHPFDAEFYNPDRSNTNHYELYGDMNRFIGEDFIFVSEDSLPQNIEHYFDSITPVKTVERLRYKDGAIEYKLYLMQNFKGY